MMRYFSLVLTIICLFSCKEKKSDTNIVLDKTMDQLTIDTPDYASGLTKLTPEFIDENNINQEQQALVDDLFACKDTLTCDKKHTKN